MIISKKLIKQKKISHGFFNRNGGKSNGVYKSLNCGTGSKDKKNNVNNNLSIVQKKIGNKSKNIFLLHQVHGNNFVFIDKYFRIKQKKIKADAIITDQRQIPIAVLTADCFTIFLNKLKFMLCVISELPILSNIFVNLWFEIPCSVFFIFSSEYP